MLSASERALLDAVADGESARSYARRLGYGPDWAKWMSRKIRAKLGASTLREALRMSETATGGLTAEEREELRQLRQELREAREALRAARTPGQEREAREDVRDAEEDLDKLARRTGLSRADLEAAQKEKRYREFNEHAERRDKEQAEAEEREKAAKGKRKPKPKADTDDDPDDDETTEEPPQTEHWSERKLFGGRTAE